MRILRCLFFSMSGAASVAVDAGLARLVQECGDQICGDNQSISSINIFKITSELAKLSCSDETLKSFKLSEGDCSRVTFTLEERNLFARLQILANQIRKQNQSHEIPLYHLSPRILLANSQHLVRKQESVAVVTAVEGQSAALSMKEFTKAESKKKKKKKILKDPLPPALMRANDQLSHQKIVKFTEETVTQSTSPLPPPPVKKLEESPTVEEASLRTTIFSHELDPTDTEGWVSVAKKKKELFLESSSSPKKNPLPRSSGRGRERESYSALRMLGDRPILPPPNTPPHPTRLLLKNSYQDPLLSSSSPTPPPLSPPLVMCASCLQLTTEMRELRTQHDTEMQNIRELHSQAIQALQLKLFIANNNLELEREDRNKIIEEIIGKYHLPSQGGGTGLQQPGERGEGETKTSDGEGERRRLRDRGCETGEEMR
jgi:hypothetical protein